MKKMIISVLLAASASVAAPNSLSLNPQIRACRITNAIFTTLDTNNDNVGFCNYQTAVIGSISILRMLDGDVSSAVQAYIDTQESSYSNCEAAGAQTLSSKQNNRASYTLCRFNDGSYIELETLKSGYFANSNNRLTKVIEDVL